MRNWLIMSGIAGSLTACERVAEPQPWPGLMEMDMLIASIWPHFESATLYPYEISFQRVRKLPDGRVCGEVALKGDNREQLDYAVFLDPMKDGESPVIMRRNLYRPDGYRDVVAHCMTDSQRDEFERAMARADAEEKRAIDSAYTAARNALRREQNGMIGDTPTYFPPSRAYTFQRPSWTSPRPESPYRPAQRPGDYPDGVARQQSLRMPSR